MSEKQKCFIIQPLNDEFKKRCDETYKPAIEQAGFSPYRVDEHYSSKKLKIEAIKEEIKKSAVCLAEITEDNPNVWYELGFADGHDIPVVLICENDKRNKLPFDVNQRDTYFYNTTSQGDWEKLQQEIAERIKIAIQNVPAKKARNDVAENAGCEFGRTELFILKSLYYDSDQDDPPDKSDLCEKMRTVGISAMDITDAFTRLKVEQMIEEVGPYIGEEAACLLTDKGRKWCLQNKELVREAG